MENLEIESFVPNMDGDNKTYKVDIHEIVKNYETHPSILKIKENVNVETKFIFTDTTPNNLKDEICKLDPNKASTENDTPTKILSRGIVGEHLAKIYNISEGDANYPLSLKLADVTPIHKKEERTLLKNYRPVSLIPTVSKLFERYMYNQITLYINEYLSPYLFGYRTGHSTEQCLTVMLEEWKKALDEKNSAGGILTDLSKAFDCLNHNLLIAKLEAYCFDESALNFVITCMRENKEQK